MTAEAFDGFVREHERMVRALALSYTRNASAADDVVQETFIRAYRSIDGLREGSKVKTWLYALARHAAIDWLRREKRHRVEELTVDVVAPAEKKTDDLTERVMKVVNGLKQDYRQIVLLRFVEEMSYADIGETLGMTSTAVGEKLHRVRRIVMERLGL